MTTVVAWWLRCWAKTGTKGQAYPSEYMRKIIPIERLILLSFGPTLVALIESHIDALMITDHRGIINDVNQKMETLTGYTRDELIGAPFKRFFTEPARAEAAITQVLREGKITNYELTTHSRSRKETIVSCNATTFYDRECRLQGVFAAARDIREYKEIERKLLENNLELSNIKAVAEKANLAKSEFLSSMNHELRTPLNAVPGLAQLMKSEVPPPTPAQKLSIDQITQAGQYLLQLINEMLELTMMESGQMTVSQESMSLKEVLRDCQAMIEPQAQSRGIRMTFPVNGESFLVRADPIRLKQILINLLSNSIKYNRPGGRVAVNCAVISKTRVRISVTDTGFGLSPTQLSYLFLPFNRLGQEAGSEEGTGTGLVATKQLIEMMGGVIGVESCVGVGSLFWIELNSPGTAKTRLHSIKKTGPIRQSEVESIFASSRRTLLYVEDNPANLKLVEQLISRRKDLKLVSATDGNMGIELARSHQPDVILMDINLPELCGYSALKILREDPKTAHIPVIALSTMAIPHDIEKEGDAGFFRYLTKPLEVDEFMNTLDIALNRNSTKDAHNATEPLM